MLLRQLFDHETSTYTYLLADEHSGDALLIDPVLEQAERDLILIRELGLTLRYSLDTHVHADHVTASGTLRERTQCRTVSAVGGAACADLHVRGGDSLTLGSLRIEVLPTPGHTDDSVSYRVGDHVFTGDALLVRGTGRTDFQNGNPSVLYDSITKTLFALPDDTQVWPGHDYKGHAMSTIGEERRLNPRLAGKTREDFVDIMNNLGLPPPKNLERAVPANRACGVGLLNQEKPAPRVIDVDPAQIAALLPNVRVIDVREPEEFTGELGHLDAAELVPLASLEDRASDWDKQQPLLVVCRSGRRSLAAAENLLTLGFERVMNLRGGMLAVRAAK
jgi:glyoxylase-like metal-dependent hydrolase (beta-lactamase superfamily II)/rhodanese-related sulfurtransferase